MTRARRKPPLRQPRGPRATITYPPRPEHPQEIDYRIDAACHDCGNWNDQCTCQEETP